MTIKISVVIPTYNRPSRLLNCLQSLENQSLEKEAYEVIVVSDGPDLETRGFMKHWLSQTDINAEYLHGEVNEGPAAARNRGWRSAQAALIAFTDDDCLPDKDWLASLLKNYKQEELIAYTGKTEVPLPQNPSDFALNLSKLSEAEFITANCACTKAALHKVGGFDERFRMAWREDSDLEFKFISNKIPIKKTQDAIVVHPVYPVKWGVSAKDQKKGIYDALLFKKHPQLFRKKIHHISLWHYYFMIFLFLGLLSSLLFQYQIGIIIFASLYLLSLLLFTYKRLQRTNYRSKHAFEMLSTSILIPFLSVYYRWYGAIKFRTFFF